MDINVISTEIQQSYILVYGTLIFWALVFLTVAAVIEVIYSVIDDWRLRQSQ
jgi:ABC-type dipeptide/oligopeptide/nickel transport system permease component